MEMDPFFAVVDAKTTKPKEASKTSSQDEDNGSQKTVDSGTLSQSHPPTNDTQQEAAALEETWTVLAKLLQQGHLEQRHVSVVQSLIRDNCQQTEKINKLKNLLTRSAKAQKDSKAEVTSTKIKLEEAQQTIQSLHGRIDHLANRPTHYLDLVADFESNFDRALLALGNNGADGHGGGNGDNDEDADAGQDTSELQPVDHGAVAAASSSSASPSPSSANNAVLVSELQDCRAQLAKVESLNTALLARASKLEHVNQELRDMSMQMERQSNTTQLDLTHCQSQVTALQMQLRDKVAALSEMQMEIDLVTRASVHARAAAAAAAASSSMSQPMTEDQTKLVEELQSKVTALTEWALASAESKQLAVQRVKELEVQLRQVIHQSKRSRDAHSASEEAMSSPSNDADVNGLLATGAAGANAAMGDDTDGSMGDTDVDEDETNANERRLWKASSSMVIGAGQVGSYICELENVEQHKIDASKELVVLRWRFDLTPSDMDVVYSIYKGKCQSAREWSKAHPLIKNRNVLGGGGGDVESAFVVQNACTLVWSNQHSWVRPRTVKFTVEAIAITETDD